MTDPTTGDIYYSLITVIAYNYVAKSHYILTLYVQSDPVCSSVLTFVDLDTGEIITLEGITFTTQEVKVNRHYNVTVNASNSVGSTTSYVTISECSYII